MTESRAKTRKRVLNFVSLDNFRRLTQNKNIETKLEAWLHFLSRDEPEEIIRLIRTYPEFRPPV